MTGFAGHGDWRIPNVKELSTFLDYGRSFPAMDPAFNDTCNPGCTVLTCSCTKSGATPYRSSTTLNATPALSFGMNPDEGG